MLEAGMLLFLFLTSLATGLGLWTLLRGSPGNQAGLAARVGILSLISLPVLGLATYRLVNSRHFQLAGQIVARVEARQKLVALTFDDGPAAPYTEQLLAVLRARAAHATFFTVGAQLAKYPDLARIMVKNGHELGNHSYSHQRMVFKSPAFVRQELERTDALIRQAGYTGDIHFRSPYFKKLLVLPLYLQQAHQINVMADVEPDDIAEVAASPAKIVSYVQEQVRPGSIILLHAEGPSRATSLQAVAGILKSLQAQGYRFVTVSELLAARLP